MVIRGDKKERSNTERGGKNCKEYSEVEGSLEPPQHRKVEKDGINEVSKLFIATCHSVYVKPRKYSRDNPRPLSCVVYLYSK